MAKNNYWDIVQGKVVPQPQPPAPNPAYPKVVILDPYAEGVTSYTLSYTELSSLETVYIVANTTTIGIGSVTIYLPSLPSGALSKKITIQSMSVDDVVVEASAGAYINQDSGFSMPIKPANGGAPNVITAATFIADTQISPSWYTLYNFYTL